MPVEPDFAVISVPDDAANQLEQLGTKPKFWFSHDGIDYLFKEGRVNTGEDWAEKVVFELSRYLDIPAASYELACWRGRRGVITRKFVPDSGRLVHGNELLANLVEGYPGTRFYRVREHVLRLVLAVVRYAEPLPPLNWLPFDGVTSALDVFLGYLMLDVLVANQDRHHENWGMVVTPQGQIHLAPTYDHASSLGRNETDENRRARLTTRDSNRSMEAYVRRARSAFYESASKRRPLGTLDAFQRAADMRPAAARAWLKRLAGVRLKDVESILGRVPEDRISAVGIEFACRIIQLNRERLLALG